MGVVEPPRPVHLHRAHRLVAPRRRLFRPPPGQWPGHPHRAGVGSAVLVPVPAHVRRIRSLAAEVGASLVGLDPALPLGLVGPGLGLPFAVVLHGAEVTVPGRLPVARPTLGAVLGRARLVIAAGRYPAAEARRAAPSMTAPVVEVPPGVDLDRFRPLSDEERAKARASWGLPAGGPLLVSISRLVPRKGMDVLIDAAAALEPSFPGLDRGHRRRRP